MSNFWKSGAALILFAGCIGFEGRQAEAAPFSVTDADFSGNTYELRYYTSTNRLVKNGVVTIQDSTPLGELLITNAGNTAYPAYQYFGADGGVRYMQAVGAGGGWYVGTNSTYNTSAAATMGWDLSSVTGQVAKVEVLSRQYLLTALETLRETRRSSGHLVRPSVGRFGEVGRPAPSAPLTPRLRASQSPPLHAINPSITFPNKSVRR